MTDFLTDLPHAEDCAQERVERVDSTRPDGRPVTVLRCTDCGVQAAAGPPAARLAPGSAEWLAAWDTRPDLICAGLTDEELGDPAANPAHPYAVPPAGLVRFTPRRPPPPYRHPPAHSGRVHISPADVS